MIQNIQSLRFLAAALVLLHHMYNPWVPEPLARMGFAGVDIFFVISGYIMAETTRSTEPGAGNALRFLFKRFSRIYSGWWPFFLVYLVLAYLSGGVEDRVSLPGSFFLVPQDLPQNLEGITWTLSFELYFYLLTGILLAFTRKWMPHCFAMAGVLLIVLNVYHYGIGLYQPENAHIAKQNMWVPFYTSPLILEFIAGFLFAEWFARRREATVLPWVVTAGVSLAACYALQEHFGVEFAGFFKVSERVVLYGSFALSLIAIAVNLEKMGITPLRMVQKMGDASYSIYLSHPAIIAVMGYGFHHWGIAGKVSLEFWMSLCAVLVVVFSVLNYRWVERPLYRLFLGLAGRKKLVG